MPTVTCPALLIWISVSLELLHTIVWSWLPDWHIATFEMHGARDGDGAINVDEFQSLLSVIGMDATDAEASDLVSEVDSDGSKRMGA